VANAAFGLMSNRIDNWAHLGGLLGGGAIAFMLGPNYEASGGRGLNGGRKLTNKPLLQTFMSEKKRELGLDDKRGKGTS